MLWKGLGVIRKPLDKEIAFEPQLWLHLPLDSDRYIIWLYKSTTSTQVLDGPSSRVEIINAVIILVEDALRIFTIISEHNSFIMVQLEWFRRRTHPRLLADLAHHFRDLTKCLLVQCLKLRDGLEEHRLSVRLGRMIQESEPIWSSFKFLRDWFQAGQSTWKKHLKRFPSKKPPLVSRRKRKTVQQKHRLGKRSSPGLGPSIVSVLVVSHNDPYGSSAKPKREKRLSQALAFRRSIDRLYEISEEKKRHYGQTRDPPVIVIPSFESSSDPIIW